jgi:hypothetical protein
LIAYNAKIIDSSEIALAAGNGRNCIHWIFQFSDKAFDETHNSMDFRRNQIEIEAKSREHLFGRSGDNLHY